ncbi:MAG: hypothetical protein OMM_14483, partial [Candidatus Magnetoglobus multicellularis str. Araruama]
MSTLPGYAAQPFLQGITNGEVIYLKFSEDECLFVAIKNNASSLLYDQKSYSVTSGSVSIMKIAPNGNLEWIKDLYSDLNNMGVDYTENVFYGRPGVIKIETSSSEIFVMVSLSSTYGGKYLVYDCNGNLQKSIDIGTASYYIRNMSMKADNSPVVIGDIPSSASAGGTTHSFYYPEINIVNMEDATSITKYDKLAVKKTHYTDDGTLEYQNNAFYINAYASAVVTDPSDNIYTISSSTVFVHGANSYTTPTPEK